MTAVWISLGALSLWLAGMVSLIVAEARRPVPLPPPTVCGCDLCTGTRVPYGAMRWTPDLPVVPT